MFIKSIFVIVNPVAGQSKPVAQLFKQTLSNESIHWDLSETKKEGDADQLAKNAVKAGVDCVAICGGDGTLREAAGALKNTDTSLAILPGGTGNVLANELGLTASLKDICGALTKDVTVRVIDIGQCNDECFLLRISSGYEAELVKGADRKLKTQAGWLAYAFSGVKALLKTKSTHYFIESDGESLECDGLSCVIANSGNLGLPGVSFWPWIKIDDGMLDLFVIRKTDIDRLLSMDIKGKELNVIKEFFIYKRAHRVTLRSEPHQEVHRDGDLLTDKRLNINILPKALKVVTLDQ